MRHSAPAAASRSAGSEKRHCCAAVEVKERLQRETLRDAGREEATGMAYDLNMEKKFGSDYLLPEEVASAAVLLGTASSSCPLAQIAPLPRGRPR